MGGFVLVVVWKLEFWFYIGEMCYGNKGFVYLMNLVCLLVWFFMYYCCLNKKKKVFIVCGEIRVIEMKC